MNLEDARNIAVIAAALVGAATLLKGVFEYMRQNAQKRAELYMQLGKQFIENTNFKRLFDLLDRRADDELRQLEYAHKLEFLRFFEDIAVLMNSRLIRPHVAHYMFAYYAIGCWESDGFWSDINRDSKYWALFRQFVAKMQSLEDAPEFKSSNYRV